MKSKPLFSDRSNIQLGFEVECYVKDKYRIQFEKEIQVLGKIILSDDGSIEPPEISWDSKNYCRYHTYELQTPVLPPYSAMIMLEKVFEILKKYGGTNESCGLHVNISSKNKNKMKRFNPVPFIFSPMWNKLLRDFRREDNEFCLPAMGEKGTPMDKFYDFKNYGSSCFDKDSCVNFDNWSGGIEKSSRIEIRGMGNDKYHYRFNTVSRYVRRIMKLFMICCDAPLISKKFRV